MANMCKHKTLHKLTQHIGIYSRPFNKCQTGVYKVANSIKISSCSYKHVFIYSHWKRTQSKIWLFYFICFCICILQNELYECILIIDNHFQQKRFSLLIAGFFFSKVVLRYIENKRTKCLFLFYTALITVISYYLLIFLNLFLVFSDFSPKHTTGKTSERLKRLRCNL